MLNRRLLLGSTLSLLAFSVLLCSGQDLSESYRNALVAYKSGQYTEASQAVEKSIAESPKEARPLLLRGRINTALKKYDDAEKDLRSALKLDHSSNIGYFYLGNLFYAQRKYDKARIEYTSYHHQVPDDVDGTLKLVYCAIGAADLGEAQRLANTLNLFDEKNPSAYFSKAAIARFKEQGKPHPSDHEKPESEKLLQQAETLYGNIVYGSYLPDYLFLFSQSLSV